MPHLVWLYYGALDKVLEAATWLDTTDELRKLGWRVTLVTAGPPDQQRIRGTEVFCIPRPEKYLISQIVYHMRFLKFIKGQMKDVDIILFHPMSALWLLPLRLMRGSSPGRRPLLVMDIRSLHMPQQGKQGWKGWLRGTFQEIANLSAGQWIDGYLTITQRMTDAITIPPQKFLGVWPSGVNLDLFTPASSSRNWPSPKEPVNLVYIGALHFERNLMTLCHAVNRANSDGMLFNLRLVGDGSERVDLERIADGSGGKIRVAKPVSHAQVPEILAWAHVGVLPFPDEEKFRVSSPIKLFEYMAAGLPILATRIQCHTDVMGNGEYVFWAEDASEQSLVNALCLVWRSRTVLNEMGNLSNLAAKEWTWAASAEKLHRALENGYRFFMSPVNKD